MVSTAKKFPRLGLWDAGESTGPEHMAKDEALLRCADFPVLRWYRWARPEISFGYPMRWSAVEKFAAGRPAVRRWTGGGIVEHGNDFTIAIAAPAKDCGDAPTAFYERVHLAIAAALDTRVHLAAADDCSCGDACFENPARFDVLHGTQKVAGGAIRRSREGTLYQGSIQAVKIPSNFISLLAENLAEESAPWLPDERLDELAAHLRHAQYATPAWLAKR